jgi:two-component system, OmpR family, alkaline phosphatase synthesis response regulator PhoP
LHAPANSGACKHAPYHCRSAISAPPRAPPVLLHAEARSGKRLCRSTVFRFCRPAVLRLLQGWAFPAVPTPFAPLDGFPIMPSMPKSKILIADDNNTNVELLEAYLDCIDCEIAVAIDGADTLTKVAEFQPDLILLDIMMPKLSGFEVCKKLKQDPVTRQIMVLMVTALTETGDIERGVAAGCDDFLSKPINKIELVKRVELMLKLRHVTDELERLRRYIDNMEGEGDVPQ